MDNASQTKSVSRPETLDAGLLMLRIGAGFSLFALFGLAKVKSAFAFSVHHQPWIFIEFLRRLGFPLPTVAAFVQTLNESLGALFVLIGFYTRAPPPFSPLVSPSPPTPARASPSLRSSWPPATA